MADGIRSWTAGRFAFELDGQMAGFIKEFSGGHCTADVITHDLGADQIARKHIGNLTYQPMKLKVGLGMTKGFVGWMNQSFKRQCLPKDGAIHSADTDYKIMATRDFFGAYITTCEFPACDAKSKEGAYISLTIDPERTVDRAGDKSDMKGNLGIKTKKWLPSNFLLDISGLPCKRVSKISAVKFEVKLASDYVGAFRDATKHPAKATFTDIDVTFSMADYPEWRAYYEDFVIKGNSSDANEKDATLTWLANDAKTPLAELTLKHMGMVSLERVAASAGKEEIDSATAKFYVEEGELTQYSEADM